MAYPIQAFTSGMTPVPYTEEQIGRSRRQIEANKAAWAALLEAQKAGKSDAECIAIHDQIARIS